jgi:hypothetical protein
VTASSRARRSTASTAARRVDAEDEGDPGNGNEAQGKPNTAPLPPVRDAACVVPIVLSTAIASPMNLSR